MSSSYLKGLGVRSQGSVHRSQESGGELEFRVGVGGRVGVSTQESGVSREGTGVSSWSWSSELESGGVDFAGGLEDSSSS